MERAGWVGVASAVARRPVLWLTAVGQARRLIPRRWWRRRPFLPLPDRDWLAFRALTQYGDAGRTPTGPDVVAWLRWVRSVDTGARRRSASG